ncbi:MAG: hypothetical protein NC429_03775 [Lachnospiraceae bacterium]|nr:hypothetical protein [Lachnospiraceae bacterium]
MKKANRTLFILMYVFSMLVLEDVEIIGLKLAVFLLFVLAVVQAVNLIGQMRKEKRKLKIEYKTDLAMIVILGFELISIILKLFQNPLEGAVDYQFQVILLLIVFWYFFIKETDELTYQHLDISLYICLAAMAFFLLYSLCDKRLVWLIDGILENSGVSASYLIIPCLICIVQYCMCRDKFRSVFYILAACVSFFSLIVNHNIVSFWMMAFTFLAIPILFMPTAELVKRDMQMMFIFFFMLSNMSLLTNYTLLFRNVPVFDLQSSVYLELLLAAGGIAFFHYWEHIPEGTDLNRLVLRKMHKIYRLTLVAAGIVFLGIIIGGDYFRTLPDGIGFNMVKGFAIPLVEEIKQTRSGFVECLQSSVGSWGLLLFWTVLVIEKMKKNYSFEKTMTSIFILFTIIFILQCFFWMPSIHVLPFYIVMTVSAVSYKEEIKKVSGIKVNHLNLDNRNKIWEEFGK